MKPSSFTEYALRDIARVPTNYDREKESLGQTFIDRVYEAFDRIVANPEGYSVAYKQLRRCSLRNHGTTCAVEMRDTKG